MPPDQLHAEIGDVLNRLCACWGANRLEPIIDLWDALEPTPYALPQEIAEPVIGWEALRGYFRRAEDRLYGASMRFWDLKTKTLSPDMAVALYQMHWNGHIKGFAYAMGVNTRVTAIFRKRPAGWLICHYVEAPPAMMLHLQQGYAAAVDPDFKISVTPTVF